MYLNSLKIVLIILFYQLLQLKAHGRKECIDYNKNKGQCLPYSSCSSNLGKTDLYSDMCDNKQRRYSRMVCCPKRNFKMRYKFTISTPTTTTPTSTTTLTTPTTTTASIVPSTSKSKEMCLIYSKYKFKQKYRLMNETKNPSCGFHTRKYIFGGNVTDPYEFPHMAIIILKNNQKLICGGSLISNKFILTAAHCVHDGKPHKYEVRLSQMNGMSMKKKVRERRMMKYNIEEIILMPDYKFPLKYNDIALIKLKENVQFSRFIHPACLPEEKTNAISTPKVIATGYGMESIGSIDYSAKLKKVILKLHNINVCMKYNQKSYILTEGLNKTTQLCVGDVNSDDACQGDSGGPVQIYNLQFCTYTIVGIISYGKRCGLYPSIVTHIYPYKEWIETNIWK